MDKNKVMLEWLLTCPNVSHLYALFGDVEDGTQHLYRLADGVITERKYVDGGKFKQIYSDWQLLCFSSAAYNWQAPATSENLTEYGNAQAICDWIQAQREARNFPALDGVEDIEPIPTNPQILGTDVNGLAKYAIGVRLTFKGSMTYGS